MIEKSQRDLYMWDFSYYAFLSVFSRNNSSNAFNTPRAVAIKIFNTLAMYVDLFNVRFEELIRFFLYNYNT